MVSQASPINSGQIKAAFEFGNRPHTASTFQRGSTLKSHGKIKSWTNSSNSPNLSAHLFNGGPFTSHIIDIEADEKRLLTSYSMLNLRTSTTSKLLKTSSAKGLPQPKKMQEVAPGVVKVPSGYRSPSKIGRRTGIALATNLSH